MTSPSLGTLDEHVLELNVHDYARALWRHRVRIALVVLVFGGTAAAATLARPPEYHAAATMTVIHDEGQPPPPIASYQQLVEDPAAAADVVRSLGADAAANGLTAETLLRDRLIVTPSRDLNLLTVEATMWSASLAAEVANRMAQSAVARVERIEAPALAHIRPQVDAAKQRLSEALDKLSRAAGERGVSVFTLFSLVRGQVDAGRTPAAGGRALTADEDRQLTDAAMDYEVARSVYIDVAARYERMRLQAAAPGKSLQIIDPASPPSAPVAKRPLRSAALGAAIGFALAALWVMVGYIKKI
ncbi:MAG TPA: Wzz/FepE/Etk N-terminal domain-containing protein [Vicinamibacterales bacterium]|jgi:capsular polysaccharide biosynthesis protein